MSRAKVPAAPPRVRKEGFTNTVESTVCAYVSSDGEEERKVKMDLDKVLQHRRKNNHIRSGDHTNQFVVCHVQVENLASWDLRSWEKWVERTLSEEMATRSTDDIFSALDLLFVCYWIALLRHLGTALEERLVLQVEEDIDGGDGKDHLVDGEGRWIRQKLHPLRRMSAVLERGGNTHLGQGESLPRQWPLWKCDVMAHEIPHARYEDDSRRERVS